MIENNDIILAKDKSWALSRISRRIFMSGFNAEAIKQNFPFWTKCPISEPLVYLDNAATETQAGASLLKNYYLRTMPVSHRGVLHALAERATALMKSSRKVRSLSMLLAEVPLLHEPRQSLNWVAQFATTEG